MNVGSLKISVPDPPMSEDPSLLKITKLKFGKTAGICGIPAKLLKSGGEHKARGLHAFLAVI